MTHPARGGLTRRRAVTLAAAAATLALHRRTARAASPGDVVRIGVLSDMNGPFADQVGPGSVAAARLAAEDFAAEANGLKVEVLSGDHQNKPDIGVGIARHWVDVDGVGAVVDLPNSAVALAVSDLMREKRRVALCSSSASSDITGKACAATTVQWVLDTWSLGHSTANALLAQGAKDWFFLTVDYALGHTLERDTAAAVTAGGGRVLGSVLQPLGTAGFSAALLQAQASGANVLALANTGADAINAIKQAGEFGLTAKMRVAALSGDLGRACDRPAGGAGAAAHRGLLLGPERPDARLEQALWRADGRAHAHRGSRGRLFGEPRLPARGARRRHPGGRAGGAAHAQRPDRGPAVRHRADPRRRARGACDVSVPGEAAGGHSRAVGLLRPGAHDRRRRCLPSDRRRRLQARARVANASRRGGIGGGPP